MPKILKERDEKLSDCRRAWQDNTGGAQKFGKTYKRWSGGKEFR